MAAHIKHTRRQVMATADARNTLLARKTEERQAASAARERHIRELLRVTESRSKIGVGGFPRTQEVPAELLKYYLTPFPDGTFPSIIELVQRHLAPTPEPEPQPEPEPEPEPVAIPELEPTPVETEAASPEVKTEEDDTPMDESDEPVATDGDDDVEMQAPPIVPPSLPPPEPTPAEESNDPLPFAPSPPKMNDPQPAAEPRPEPASDQTPSSPTQARQPRTKFDPSRPLQADQTPLAPPPQDARIPSASELKGMMFPEGEEPEETVNPALITAPPNPPQTPTTINPTLTLSTPTTSRQTPASTPLRTPTTSNAPTRLTSHIKPLTNAYTASLPPLPQLPPDIAKKVAGVKVRRRGMQNSGPGVNWGENGIWKGAQTPGAAAGGLGPGGAGAQGWWASLSVGQAPQAGTSNAPQPGMELLRWQAILQINPAHVFARRPTKCVTTHEWRVLRRELEYTRAMQRIESLKQDGMWSFRQPKKQRGPVMPKTHWDYLMDEMKWLQVDFREERRWKTALAFEIAHAVKDWHDASPEERKEMRVGFRRVIEAETEGEDMEMGETDKNGDVEMQGVGLGEDGKANEVRSEPDDDGEGEQEPEPEPEKPHTEGLAPREDVMGADEPTLEIPAAVEEKKDEGEEPGMLTKDWAGDADAEGEVEDVLAMEGIEDSKGTLEDTPGKDLLDAENEDPVQGALRANAAGDATLVGSEDPTPSKEEEERLNAVRNELLEFAQTPSLATTFSLPPLSEKDSVDALVDLFPDLSLYTGLPSTIEADPNKQEKRPDESMSSVAAGKLAHTSRLMDVRPVLVGTLDPARHLFKTKWEGLDEVPAVEDGREVGAIRTDTVFTGNYLFAPERKPEEKQVRRRPDSGMVHPLAAQVPAPPRDAAARLERVIWTSDDDVLLKSVCDAYPNSWALIADVFNSSRVTIKPDMRTPWDCCDRYMKLYGGGIPEEQERKPGFPVEIALPSPGGTVKKDVKAAAPKRGVFENKKQVRQHFLYDTLRKVVRKRENANKANQPPKRTIPPPHETHSQLASGQRIYTPAELSKLKAERDQRHYSEMMKRRQEIYQQAVAAGRPVPRMPPGLVNVPIRTAQMNAHMQMQMQQQQAQQSGTQQSPSQQPQVAQPATQPGQLQSTDPQVQAQFAARMQTAQRAMPNQQQAQALLQAGMNGQMSPPNQAAQSPNLLTPGMQAGGPIARPSSAMRPGSGSPGIVNGQAMSHLLRTNGMHQMHLNLANGVIPPNMQQNSGMTNGNSVFGNGLVNGSMRGQLGPEQMNQLLLQQAARQISAQMQQNQQPAQNQTPAQPTAQLQVPTIQQSPPTENDVTMQ